MVPDDGVKPQIAGGPLPNGTVYEFVNVHFHWGSDDNEGSEHVLNGKRYSSEVHAVHYNTKYDSIEEALMHSDGIAVVTSFYQATDGPGLPGLQDVSNVLPSITEYESSTQIDNFKLSGLYGGIDSPTKNVYFTYAGSLTTPPCSESVIWIIFIFPLSVNSQQLKPFRDLEDENGEALVENFRNVQNGNGRIVYLNRPRPRPQG